MCKSRWLLLVTLAAGAEPLSGQNLAPFKARADSLLREWREANAFADLVDSLERIRAGAGGDTVSVGALRIVTNPSPLPVRAAAARACPAIDSLYGTEAQSLAQRPYFIEAVDPDTTVERRAIHVGIQVPWDLNVSTLAQLLLANVPIAQPDPALGTWLGGQVRPPIYPHLERARVYVELVTAPSQAARSCFLGEIESCRYALDLVESPETFLRWYPSPAERRAIVTRSLAGLNYGAQQRAFQSCAGGSDSACIELLRSVPKGVLPSPLAYDARGTLVQVALRLGGRDAYHRLLMHPEAAMADRLAAASGVSIDTLVTRWEAEIHASRPSSVTLPRWGLWVALGWAGLFAACGLRSSRWRVS